ncbi:hypothetical protein ACTJJ0_10605 [Chitinophaga sp. 22321]|uniref:ATP-binding protein n=1 Tax=Chitinophaga hostae TaxID=2831022 RepID=A0ABS5ISR5_9BACT|nr:hypothetical protein [Chitinophaga hostae]MBS0025998.1 hypothetical protein [Chitinophaga hostae]
MKKYIPILSLLFTPFVTQAQQTITGLALPESAVAYKGGYFVSDIGVQLDAVAKDGDGAISYINGGKLEALRYFDDTLNAPKGLDIIGNILYVADIDHLKGYNITTRKKVFDLNLEGKAVLLNDLSRVDDSSLVVTDSFKDHALMVNVHTGKWSVLKGEMKVPNGIVYNAHNDEVYVCSMGPDLDGTGKLFAKKLHDDNAAFEPLEGSPAGVLDGIVLLDDHRLLVSDWIKIKDPATGNLFVYDLDKKQYKTITTERAPADIALDTRKHSLLVPQLLDNRLAIIPLKKLGL